MKIACVTLGAYVVGFLIPEFLFMLSRNERFNRVPTMQNILCAFAFGLIALGLMVA